MNPSVKVEVSETERIVYKRGSVYIILEGFHAWLYRQMIWHYGKARATDEFWWLWHKKEGSAT